MDYPLLGALSEPCEAIPDAHQEMSTSKHLQFENV